MKSKNYQGYQAGKDTCLTPLTLKIGIYIGDTYMRKVVMLIDVEKRRMYKVGSAPSEAVYVGRGSIYGNPFIMGKDGDRKSVVNKFYHYALWRLSREPNWLDGLKDKDLVCYCYPALCHGDMLISIVKDKYK